MNTDHFPPLFLSHGSPMTALEPREAGAFMHKLGRVLDTGLGRPRAVLMISAHTSAKQVLLLGGLQHQAIYDFGGFADQLRTLRYDANGAPDLAEEIVALTRHAAQSIQLTEQSGLDHGAWVPLRYLYPDADVPVLPLAFVANASPAQQFALGQMLAPLAQSGVLIIASGSITHNLGLVFGQGRPPAIDAPEIEASRVFRNWWLERSAARDWQALLDYRAQAPFGIAMHPTDEHLLPWFITAGAGGVEAAPHRLHSSLTFGSLGMDAYAFGPATPRLVQALATNQSAAAILPAMRV
ncbi:dioxygenase family protein [Roseateles oligotrophus]|uniref:Dioxygenase n=1 Tax=Roseateles oligotrophus TaxID=1769250 RepID=A0ABT2YAX9_9BURK|nr:class III extradiol ring-cleavage dioxygenase [Roseateles oligotrophus]MCV2366737.1 dioxygenase [Roseateles oligotrophus]